MKSGRLVALGIGLGWIAAVLGCARSAEETADPCEVRDSDACTAEFEAAARALAEARCGNYEACFPGSVALEFGTMAKCADFTAAFYDSVLRRAGVAATPEDLRACAVALDKAGCSVEEPECKLIGSKTPGEGCVSGLECTSFRCGHVDSPCGQCESARAKGDGCDPENDDCDYGLACSSFSHVCQERAPKGTSCVTHNECASNLFCVNGVCGPTVDQGEACTYDECDVGLWCNAVTATCDVEVLVGVGETCGYAEDGRLHWCKHDAWCNGVCTPYALEGQPCADSLCAFPSLCIAGRCTLDFNTCP
jgi:hypothetical protein